MHVTVGRCYGSSPQVRGTLGAEVDAAHVAGLIPAGAGNTIDDATETDRDWAHPRRCGEHSVRPRAPHVQWGSSPQVRGTPGAAGHARLDDGLIPAGAGNTSRTEEHEFDVDGSSPQVRGTRGGLFEV